MHLNCEISIGSQPGTCWVSIKPLDSDNEKVFVKNFPVSGMRMQTIRMQSENWVVQRTPSCCDLRLEPLELRLLRQEYVSVNEAKQQSLQAEALGFEHGYRQGQHEGTTLKLSRAHAVMLDVLKEIEREDFSHFERCNLRMASQARTREALRLFLEKVNESDIPCQGLSSPEDLAQAREEGRKEGFEQGQLVEAAKTKEAAKLSKRNICFGYNVMSTSLRHKCKHVFESPRFGCVDFDDESRDEVRSESFSSTTHIASSDSETPPSLSLIPHVSMSGQQEWLKQQSNETCKLLLKEIAEQLGSAQAVSSLICEQVDDEKRQSIEQLVKALPFQDLRKTARLVHERERSDIVSIESKILAGNALNEEQLILVQLNVGDYVREEFERHLNSMPALKKSFGEALKIEQSVDFDHHNAEMMVKTMLKGVDLEGMRTQAVMYVCFCAEDLRGSANNEWNAPLIHQLYRSCQNRADQGGTETDFSKNMRRIQKRKGLLVSSATVEIIKKLAELEIKVKAQDSSKKDEKEEQWRELDQAWLAIPAVTSFEVQMGWGWRRHRVSADMSSEVINSRSQDERSRHCPRWGAWQELRKMSNALQGVNKKMRREEPAAASASATEHQAAEHQATAGEGC